MAKLINPEDLIVQYNIPHRDEKAFEGVFGKGVSSAKKIYIPPGDWELSRMLVVSEPVIIEGEGAGISNLIYNGTGPAIVLFFMDGITTGSGIQNLTIKTTNPQSDTSGVRIDSAELFFIRNTEFIGFNGNNSYGLLAQNSTRNLLIDNSNFSGNELGLDLDAIQGGTFKNLSLDNIEYNLRINNSGNIIWQGGVSKGEAATAGISITDGYSITIEGVEHNLDGYGVYAVETAGTMNQSINIKNCSFYNNSSSKNYIDFTNVDGGTISENTFSVSSGDTALSITNSNNLTLGLQSAIYPNSPYIASSGSGYAWAFGDTEGSNTGAIDIEAAPSQATWYVDPVDGDDSAQGDTAETAIKTFAEFQRRTNANTFQQLTIVNVLNDVTEKVGITGAWPNGLWINGIGTEVTTGTLTGAQAYSAPNTMGYLEDTAVADWNVHAGHMIEITSGPANGAKAFIVSDLGSGQVRTSPLWNANSFAIQTPNAGDTYRIIDPPEVGSFWGSGIGTFGLIGFEIKGSSAEFLPALRTNGNSGFYEHCYFSQEHFWHYSGLLQLYGCHVNLSGSLTNQVYMGILEVHACSFADILRSAKSGANIHFRFDNYFMGAGQIEMREGGTVTLANNSSLIFMDKSSLNCIELKRDSGLYVNSSNVEVYGSNISADGVVASKGTQIEWPVGSNFDSIFQISTTGDEIVLDESPTTFASVGSSGRLDDTFKYPFINVQDFGATGDGTTDDTAAIQAAIDFIVNTGRQAPIFFPAGTYIVTEPILLPVSIQGLEIYGAGRAEISTATTTIRNNNTDGYALFQTDGTGTFAYFKCHGFRLLQSANAGYFFQFDNLTVDMTLYDIHMNMSNTAAGAVLMNEVENHLNWIHDCKVVTNGATVPMFHWDGPPTSNMSTTKFERVTINSPNSSAPQYLIRHKHTNASPGYQFIQCNIEQPDGGGVHLYGVGAVLESCIVSDTGNQTAPTFLIDRHSTEQSGNEATFINCSSFIGNATYPDLAVRNTPGLPLSPGPVNIIGGRYVYVENYQHSIMHRFGAIISNYSGDGEVHGMWLGALNTRGISNEIGANGVNRPRSLSGTATFTGSDTVTVSLVPSDPEADTDYQILLGPNANETFWVDEASKTTTSFQIKSSNETSTATVAWMFVR